MKLEITNYICKPSDYISYTIELPGLKPEQICHKLLENGDIVDSSNVRDFLEKAYNEFDSFSSVSRAVEHFVNLQHELLYSDLELSVEHQSNHKPAHFYVKD